MSDTPRVTALIERLHDQPLAAKLSQDWSVAFKMLAEELERELKGMQDARDYEKTAHARSVKSLRERIAELTGEPRQRGWEDHWLDKVGG